MTEDEAKTKWCPHAMMLTHTAAWKSGEKIFEGGYSYNRSPDADSGYILSGCKCMGSACMAWRWERNPGPVEVGVYSTDKFNGDGYCGLAGKP